MKVWCVGARRETAFCDVYASLDSAIAAVRKCLIDPHWFNALSKQNRNAFRVLLRHGDFDDALRFFNANVGDDDKWFIVEREVKD